MTSPHRAATLTPMLAVSINPRQCLQQFDAAWRRSLRDGLRQCLEGEAQRLRHEAAAQFATAGAHGGEPWARRKRTKDASRPLLTRTGALRRSLTDQDDPAHVEKIDVDARGNPILLFGSSISYAGFHQRGTRHMTARPLLTPTMLQGSLANFL